jgi:hypothetical protein
MRVQKLVIVMGIALCVTLLFFGLFFLIAGVLSLFFGGSRIGVMLTPLMFALGGSLIAAGIIIVLKLFECMQSESREVF